MPAPPTPRTTRIRRLIGVVLLGVTAVGAVVFYPRFEAHKHWSSAREALAREDFESARAHLALCQRLRPSVAEYAFEAGRVARRQRDYRSAESLRQKASDLGHPSDAIRVEQELTAVQLSGWRGNETPLIDLLERGSPDEARIREVLAEAYYRDFVLGPALEQALAWARVEPGSAAAWLLIGEIRLRFRDRAGAGEAFRQSIERNPMVLRAHVGLADALAEQGRPDEAVRSYEAALRLSPRDRAARIGLVKALVSVNRLPDARTLASQVLADFPSDREALGVAGRVELASNRPAEAEGLLRSAAEGSNDWLVLHDLQQALARQGKGAEAQALQVRVDRLREDFDRLDVLTREVQKSFEPAPRIEMGRILIRNGLGREGAAWLREALRLQPDEPAAHAALADYYQGIGQPDIAAEHRRLSRMP